MRVVLPVVGTGNCSPGTTLSRKARKTVADAEPVGDI